ncbi:MAG: 1-deoxy-D-xylulose-5-phosphate reductoisomerase [Clostridia bacterium]|nr:1-deoxy-D-xylulose-5-phosphate reductoisomerase [Clostridia bacterium]
MNRSVSILGATGSVGLQAAEVAEKQGIAVDLLTANRSVKEMESLSRRLKPRTVVMADESAAGELRTVLADTSVKVLSGEGGILDGIAEAGSDTYINAILGTAGLRPTLEVIGTGKRLALANKESLVIAGSQIMKLARDKGCEIIPVDSEHSAIFQSLRSGNPCEIKRIFLTASGGAFYGYSQEELKNVNVSDALDHPTWKMGKKITVDCATLMNKGFEIIEAVHLFSVREDQIKVLIHRESVLHSAVEYIDNTVIGEMSLPDMRSAVEYSLSYPLRRQSVISPLELDQIGSLTFAPPDTKAFPLLDLSRAAVRAGGACPALLNGADEVAAVAFLSGKLPFTAISEVVSHTYDSFPDASRAERIDEILSFNSAAMARASELVDDYSR